MGTGPDKGLPGAHLRGLRECLRLTIRDVEAASQQIAAAHNEPEYVISISRLSELESGGTLPSIFKLYSLSVIYRQDLRDLLRVYGVDINDSPRDLQLVQTPSTQLVRTTDSLQTCEMPVRLDPAFDVRTTTAIGRMVVEWGRVPLAFLSAFKDHRYSYGYLGAEDWTMYPLIKPGAFLQIDESLRSVTRGPWHSEWERPVYFVETREGFVCCWCTEEGGRLTLQSHPLSPVPPRVVQLGEEAEVLGQVIAIATRLNGQWRGGPGPSGREPSRSYPSTKSGVAAVLARHCPKLWRARRMDAASATIQR